MIWGFRDSGIQGFRDSGIKGCRDLGILRYLEGILIDFKGIMGFQGISRDVKIFKGILKDL